MRERTYGGFGIGGTKETYVSPGMAPTYPYPVDPSTPLPGVFPPIDDGCGEAPSPLSRTTPPGSELPAMTAGHADVLQGCQGRGRQPRPQKPSQRFDTVPRILSGQTNQGQRPLPARVIPETGGWPGNSRIRSCPARAMSKTGDAGSDIRGKGHPLPRDQRSSPRKSRRGRERRFFQAFRVNGTPSGNPVKRWLTCPSLHSRNTWGMR